MITFKEFINEKSAGLWANIHKRRKSGKRMRKPGEKGAPTAQDFKNASKEGFTHMNVKSKARPGFKIDGPKGVHKLSPSVKREIDKNSRSTYSYLTSCLARLDIQILCHHQYQMKLCTTNKPLGFQSTVPGT